jgi:hypothetical protein
MARSCCLLKHLVMPDAAELVANHTEGTGLVGPDGHHQLVVGMDLDIDVGRLQRKAVLPVQGREVQPIALILFEFQDRPPFPEPREHVDIAAGRRMDHGNARIPLLANGVLAGHLFGLGGEVVGADPVGFVREVLLAGDMPVDHCPEHDEAPEEGDGDPDNLGPMEGFLPPDPLTRRRERHLCLARLLGDRNVGDFHDAPHEVEHGWNDNAEE